jgi:putative sterol carrier protein
MSSFIKQKSPIQSFSTYMFTALFFIFTTGVALILIVFIFGVPIFSQSGASNLYLAVLQFVAIISLFFGLILIGLGVIYSIGLMTRIRNLIDLVLSGKKFDIGENIYQPPIQQKTGLGGKVQMIRPPLTSSDSIPGIRKAISESTIQQEKLTSQQIKKESHSPSKESFVQNDNSSAFTQEKSEMKPIDVTLEEALQKIIDRYNDPKVSKAFSGWENTLMMIFPDIERSYLFKINGDQGIELTEGYEEDAEVQVKVDSDIYRKMMSKQINPIKAYSSGKLEVVGKMRTLLKLRKLMF